MIDIKDITYKYKIKYSHKLLRRITNEYKDYSEELSNIEKYIETKLF